MSFARQMQLIATNTGQKMEDVLFEGISLIAQSIVVKTPVGDPNLWQRPVWPAGYDPGKLRANWQASFGQPKTDFLQNTDEEGAQTIEKIQSVLSQFSSNVFYLVNNAPYARRIEYAGWSTQAPAGMVRTTVAGWVRTIERTAASLS